MLMRPSPSLRSLRIKAHITRHDTPRPPKTLPLQSAIPSAYYRGGTDRAVFFNPHHLPRDRALWPRIFAQLDGSNVCLVEPHGARAVVSKQAIADRVQSQSQTLDGARSLLQTVQARGEAVGGIDVDYTLVALGTDAEDPVVDVAANCANININININIDLSSAVGPYAYNARLLPPRVYAQGNGDVTVKMRNTNTAKIINATFHVAGGQAAVVGDYTIDGVTGPGSKIKLDLENPYGSNTLGKLLPTGNKIDRILDYRVTCLDGANPCVFIRADDIGVDGTILPSDLNKLPHKLALLERIRRAAAVAMRIAPTEDAVPLTIPKLGLISMSSEHPTLSGQTLHTSQTDLVVRFLSDAHPHHAIPLTAALTTAVAARIPGTLVEQLLAPDPVHPDPATITIGHPSGTLQVDVTMSATDKTMPLSATVYRTAKRLFEGSSFWVHDPATERSNTAYTSHGTHSHGMAFVLESRGQSAAALFAQDTKKTEEETLGFSVVRRYASTHKTKSPTTQSQPAQDRDGKKRKEAKTMKTRNIPDERESEMTAMQEMISRDKAREARWSRASNSKKDVKQTDR